MASDRPEHNNKDYRCGHSSGFAPDSLFKLHGNSPCSGGQSYEKYFYPKKSTKIYCFSIKNYIFAETNPNLAL